jgi:DNA polymerase III alpha subunit
MTFDRSSGQLVVGVDMRDAEDMGLPKIDILGVLVLDRIAEATRLIRGC